MSAIEVQDVRPGLVLRLDPSVLRAEGGSETNAQRDETGDRAVAEPHYFLVLEVDDAAGKCLAVPLYTKSAPGSQPLRESEKGGPADGWMGEETFFSRWQHWRIPLSAIPAASAGDDSEPANRRTYAATRPATLQDIASWYHRNRCAFRPA